VRDVPQLRAVLRNPQLAPETKADVVVEIIGEADQLLRNFLRLAAEKGRIGEIADIARELDRLMAAEEGRLDVELTTAYELSDEEADSIVKQIEQASGRRVEAARSVNADLVGGLVLKAGSLEVDSSVRGRLIRLRRELAQGAHT